MKVSLNWLKEYVDLPDSISIEDIVSKMTMTGSKVEKVEKFGEKTEKVYTARVAEVKSYPDDDSLSIIKLDFGNMVRTAVAKIPDIEVGNIVPVAIHGAKVIGKEIKVSKVKSIESECMVCHILDFGLKQREFPWVKPSGLIVFPFDTKLGEDVNNVLGLDDYIIEFEITPNRPDCLSVEGLARELAVSFNVPFKQILWQNQVKEFEKVNRVDNLGVKVQSDNCPRYMMTVAHNVQIKEAPGQMQLKLIKSGIKPINNVVDVTNYVMLELGQPLHAFSRDEIKSEEIVVRQARTDEKITTLDMVERTLSEKDLVITDGTTPIAIAGVIGGCLSGISESINSIIIESANFSRGSIRNTSKSQLVRTEASSRNEKGLPKELVSFAMNRACNLLKEVADNIDISDTVVDVYNNIQPQVKINLDYDKINSVIGEDIDKEQVNDILESLEIKVQAKEAVIPYFRQDLEIIEDLAEEVLRIYGYDKLNSKISNTSVTFGGRNYNQKLEDKLKDIVLANGYNEIYTYTFFSKELLNRMEIEKASKLRDCIKISNPLSQDYEYMRTTTLPLMLEALERNYTKKNTEVKLFELGKVFLESEKIKLGELCNEKKVLTLGMYGAGKVVDFYDIKQVVEEVLNYFNVLKTDYKLERYTESPVFHPGISAKISIGDEQIAVFGKLSPKVNKNYILPENTYLATIDFESIAKYSSMDIQFNELPKYPAVERDVAFIVNKDILSFDIEKAIKNINKDIIESVQLFDVYEGEQIGEGKKSMAYRIKLQSKLKTLEDKEIIDIMDSIVIKLENEFLASFRKS